MSTPPILIQGSPLDFELCELLGEKPADFLVLTIDGAQVPFMGTPYDSPSARETQKLFVDRLNDRTKKSLWPELFANWKDRFCREYNLPQETTSADYHPTFGFAVSRVCVGYSKHLHAAVDVFATLGDRAIGWSITKAPDGTESVYIASAAGTAYRESGTGMARLIAQAAVRLLRDNKSETPK